MHEKNDKQRLVDPYHWVQYMEQEQEKEFKLAELIFRQPMLSKQ